MKTILLLACILLCQFSLYGQGIVINEFMSSNSSVVQDEDGEYSDWVELYNPGPDAVNLQGYGLTDDPDVPLKWVFPSKVIASHGFLLIFASDKNRLAGPYLHTNFKLSSAGETLQLVDNTGAVVDNLPPRELESNYSYGRKPDGSGSFAYFTTATPGASNGTTGYSEILSKPTFSQNGGFYASAFNLTITSAIAGSSIHYTLDGSEPTPSSPVYTGALQMASKNGLPNDISTIRTTAPTVPWSLPSQEVFKANTVRAKVFKDGALSSSSVTNTYFVDPSINGKYTFPVISLTTDRSNLFSSNKGIYVPGDSYDGTNAGTGNYTKEGDAWERPAHIEFYEPNGTRAFSQDVGVRIHGGYSTRYAIKSLRLYADSDFGDKGTFNYKVFPDKNLNEFTRLILRNSGNDYASTYFKDALMHTLVKHLGYEVMAYRPSIVFINGEYWGIQNIRERYDKFHFENNYGVDQDSIDLIQRGGGADEGDLIHYQAMVSFIKNNDMGTAGNYAEVQTRMDVDNFADYWASEVIINNTDWPQNNSKWWRKRTSAYLPNAPYGHDGRWRWMLYDTDLSFRSPTDNALERATSTTLDASTEIIRFLLVNQNFKHNFINRIADQLNTTFKPERVIQTIDQLHAKLNPEIQGHLNRWNLPTSLAGWNNNVANMRVFIQQRTDPMRAHVIQKFGLGGTARVTLNVTGSGQGKIKISTILVDQNTPGASSNPYPWIGTYFKSVPVQITALASPGYKFKHWSGASQSTTPAITVTLTGDAAYTAVFEEDVTSLPVPSPFDLAQGTYSLSAWDAASPANTYPTNMIFRQTGATDPGLAEVVTSNYAGVYNATSGARMNGLGTDGFSFLNTGSGTLGAAVLGLKTLGRTNVTVNWTAATVVRNFRNYAVRLQYQVGAIDETKWNDLPTPVEYVVNTPVAPALQNFTTNLSQVIGNAIDNKPLVYLRWKYYQIDAAVTGARPQIRLDDISVSSISSASNPPVVNAGNNRYVTLPSGTVTLEGAASDEDGTIESYEWSKSSGPGVTMGATNGPSLTLDDLAEGTYVFQLTVTDDDQLTASSTVTVTVSATNQLPTVHITFPVNNATLAVGSSVVITADAADNGGNVTGVEFFVDGTFVGEAFTEPYSHNYDNLVEGTYVLSARATDNAGSSSYSNDVTVTVSKTRPVITWSNPANILVGTPLGDGQLNATSNVAGTFTYSPPSGTVLPEGNNQTLTADFVPANTDRYLPVSGITVQINVNSCNLIGITPTSLANATINLPYSQSFTASGGTGSYAYSVASGNLPAGLTLTSNGLLSGSPATAGTFSFSITATDASSCAGSQSYSLTVNPAPAGQQLVSFTLVNADNEQDIQTLANGATLNLAGLPTRNLNIRANTSPSKVGSVVFNLSGKQTRNFTEGGAPYALFGDSNGDYKVWVPAVGSYTLKGTPFTAGGGGGTAGTPLTVTFTVINQAGSNQPPVVSNAIPSQTATTGSAYSFTFAANTFTDPDGNALTYSASLASNAALPSWLSFTATTRKFSGTPPSGGTTPLSIKVTASDGQSQASTTFSLTVNPAPAGQQLVSFTLVNADNEQDIQTLANGATLNLAGLPTRNLNIRANTSPSKVGSVVFNLSGKQTRNFTEGGAPYALFGDSNGDYKVWVPAVGSYTLKGTPFTAGGGGGTAGTPLTIAFTVINQTGARLAGSEGPVISSIAGAYPNPTSNGRFKVLLSQAYQGEVSYVLVNTTGVKLAGGIRTLVEPSSELSFDFSGPMQQAGAYYLRLEGHQWKGFLKLQRQ